MPIPFIQTRALEYTYFAEDGRAIPALRGIDLTVGRGEFIALIGPNGSGKSTLARHFNALLLPTAGEVRVDGLPTSDARHIQIIRSRVGMVFQNPDNQIVAGTVEEDVAFGPENLGVPPAEIRRRVDEALEAVGMTAYRHHPPHMLSGGQKQRVAIAGALATCPDCIIFDEPTSMLDAGGRQQVLQTIRRLNAERGLTVILITQDMDEAALARRVLVMDGGRIVLDGPPEEVLEAPDVERLGLGRPFAAEVARRLREQGIPLPPGLLTVEALAAALDRIRKFQKDTDGHGDPTVSGTLPRGPVSCARPHRMHIQVQGLTHIYARGTPAEREALRGIHMEIGPEERVALAGPTGSGKSTLAQHMAGLLVPAAGQVLLDGVPAHARTPDARARRRQVGMAFQFPEAQMLELTVFREVAFGPRHLGLDADEIAARVRWALEMVGLDPDAFAGRVPFALSGGEMRRVALASILALKPHVLILDEPTAGLDPRGREEVLARLSAWQSQTGATLILVSHHLDEVAPQVDRVVLLSDGRVAADGPTCSILGNCSGLRAVGLAPPAGVALLEALRTAGWPVRTDAPGIEDVVAEIARCMA